MNVAANRFGMLFTVFIKELRDALRDRRSLLSAFVFALFGPLVVGMALTSLAQRVADPGPLEVELIGAEHAPALVASLESGGAILRPWPGDRAALADAVRGGDHEIALVIAESFRDDLGRFEPAAIELIWDDSRATSQQSRRRLLARLEAWQGTIAERRLIARGVSPGVLTALRLEQRDLATPWSKAASRLAMLPIFLMMAAFVGGMSTAIDVTAGERERGSLESLLLFPVSHVALAGGKWLAAVVVNLLVVVATLGISVAVLRSPKLDGLGLRFADDLGSLALWLAILLPLALFGPALQMVVALFSRSFKEAQTYLSLLVMAPALPGFVFAFRNVEIESWMRLTPIVGQQIALEEALRGEAFGWASHFGLLAVTCLLALVCVAVVARLLDHEKLVVLA